MREVAFIFGITIAFFTAVPVRAELSPQTRRILTQRACNRLRNGFTISEVLDAAAYEIRRNDPELRRESTYYGSDPVGRLSGSVSRLSNSVNELEAQRQANPLVADGIVNFCPEFSQYLENPPQQPKKINRNELFQETDRRFYQRYPGMRGRQIQPHQTKLIEEWKAIYQQVQEEYSR
ncbi:MAG: hypothetical protein GVY04_21770 [Cyanobacteria bacterium]|jgi:hypothetical protein|nr:hypothetical protein [Cyanobacteria bacterium GSL.Bin1]